MALTVTATEKGGCVLHGAVWQKPGDSGRAGRWQQHLPLVVGKRPRKRGQWLEGKLELTLPLVSVGSKFTRGHKKVPQAAMPRDLFSTGFNLETPSFHASLHTSSPNMGASLGLLIT